MKKEDIAHLAKLSRIEVTEAEAEVLAQNITSILSYVSDIEKITGAEKKEKAVGALHTVMRADESSHEPGVYTEDLLALAPERHGEYVQVQKIIDKKAAT